MQNDTSTKTTRAIADKGAHFFVREASSEVHDLNGRAGEIVLDMLKTIGPRLATAAEVVRDEGFRFSARGCDAETYRAKAHVLRREASGLLELVAKMMAQAGRLEELAHVADLLEQAEDLDEAVRSVTEYAEKAAPAQEQARDDRARILEFPSGKVRDDDE